MKLTTELKRLEMELVTLLLPGDKMTLDTRVGNSFYSCYNQIIESIKRDLRRAQLYSGSQYTFSDRSPISKPGEGTIVGWNIEVEEAAVHVEIPFQYFLIGEDLEAKLTARKKSES